MSRIDAILAGFTAQQRAAVVQDGPVIVLAGAGTGKTKTLTGAVAPSAGVRGGGEVTPDERGSKRRTIGE